MNRSTSSTRWREIVRQMDRGHKEAGVEADGAYDKIAQEDVMSTNVPRCQIVPLPDHQVSVRIDGVERLRWHFGRQYPRPFFYPLVGPSGFALTRMGHPGAPNHDHHRSVWFGHAKVLGIDFWSDQTPAYIRQKQWLCYQDGDEEASMAVRLGWYDGHDPADLLEQDLVASVRPMENGEMVVEIQAAFRPRAESLEFGKTNFGFLAVRVAKSMSKHFGGGELTNSEAKTGEKAIFGQPARWVDYSGPVGSGAKMGTGAKTPPADRIEGITFFDHPANPRSPTRWHVREDGWMGASVCMEEPLQVTNRSPLVLRYALHVHGDAVDPPRAHRLADAFSDRPGFEVTQAKVRHQAFVIRRAKRAK